MNQVPREIRIETYSQDEQDHHDHLQMIDQIQQRSKQINDSIKESIKQKRQSRTASQDSDFKQRVASSYHTKKERSRCDDGNLNNQAL